MGEHLVRIAADFGAVKGALLMLAGSNAYFISEDWLERVRPLLGRVMQFTQVVQELEDALTHALNPTIRQVSPEAWARRISHPMSQNAD